MWGLRDIFIRYLTIDSATNDARRKEFNQGIFIPKDSHSGAGNQVFNGTDLDMVLGKYDKAVKEFSRAMPSIVCLCGSTRFVDTFNKWRKLLTIKGKIVLSIEIVTSQVKENDPQHTNPKLKGMLDELHLRKIDLANEVMILNVGGYIGESTRKELNYAKIKDKTITYLEPIKDDV